VLLANIIMKIKCVICGELSDIGNPLDPNDETISNRFWNSDFGQHHCAKCNK